MLCASLGLSWFATGPRTAPSRTRGSAFRIPRASTSAPDTADGELDTVYPEGDWRNAALEASLSDEGRLHREARGRNVTYMLKVTYDEAYLGFQYQPRDATVQGEIEKALSKLTGEDRGFLGVGASGRTDTGVHARGQVVHFYARRPLTDLTRARKSLNGMLPKDIRVVELRRPHPAFHALSTRFARRTTTTSTRGWSTTCSRGNMRCTAAGSRRIWNVSARQRRRL